MPGGILTLRNDEEHLVPMSLTRGPYKFFKGQPRRVDNEDDFNALKDATINVEGGRVVRLFDVGAPDAKGPAEAPITQSQYAGLVMAVKQLAESKGVDLDLDSLLTQSAEQTSSEGAPGPSESVVTTETLDSTADRGAPRRRPGRQRKSTETEALVDGGTEGAA